LFFLFLLLLLFLRSRGPWVCEADHFFVLAYCTAVIMVLGCLPDSGEDEASHIFAEVVSVQVKPTGRDDFTAQLRVLLRPDNVAHPRSLLLELTDENDLLFYHSLALGEGDFHALRSEQRLLMDFQSFPAQLADLLRRVCGAEASGISGSAGGVRMMACLDCGTAGDSLFSIVESNHFRELTHIALRLRKGSDEVVKQHLATKLRASKSEASTLGQKLSVNSEALSQSRRQVDELASRSRIVSEERAHLEQTLEATHQRELNELRQEHGRSMAEIQRRATDERLQLESEQQQALNTTMERAKRAEMAVEDLQKQSQSLKALGDGCHEKLEMTASQLQEATKDTTELREQVRQLESIKFQQERELGGLKVQHASMKEQLAVREQHSASQATHIEEAVAQRRMLEETLAASRKQAQSLEERFALSAQEIAKGNRIIQTLHNTSKEAKAKLRLKAAAAAQQEKTVLELKQADEMSRHVLGEKEHDMLRAKALQERLIQDMDDLKKKLADAHEVIKSNQDVIEYLNRQLTDRDLKAVQPAPGFHSDAMSGFRGGSANSTALAELLGRAESLGHGRKGLGSSSSMAALGLGTGLTSLGLGSTSGSQGMADPTWALPASATGPAAMDAVLRPVAYRRPEHATAAIA